MKAIASTRVFIRTKVLCRDCKCSFANWIKISCEPLMLLSCCRLTRIMLWNKHSNYDDDENSENNNNNRSNSNGNPPKNGMNEIRQLSIYTYMEQSTNSFYCIINGLSNFHWSPCIYLCAMVHTNNGRMNRTKRKYNEATKTNMDFFAETIRNGFRTYIHSDASVQYVYLYSGRMWWLCKPFHLTTAKIRPFSTHIANTKKNRLSLSCTLVDSMDAVIDRRVPIHTYVNSQWIGWFDLLFHLYFHPRQWEASSLIVLTVFNLPPSYVYISYPIFSLLFLFSFTRLFTQT